MGRLAEVLGLTAVLFAAAGVGMSTGLAQPAPRLTAVSPEWIQRGASVEITLSGENLSGATNLLILGDPGLSARAVPAGGLDGLPADRVPKKAQVEVESTGGGIRRVSPPVAAPSPGAKTATWRIEATPEASLNPREIRVFGPGGVSNPLQINVGQWPEIAQQDSARTLQGAQTIPLPAVVSGVLSAAGQTNHFRFKATRGQELVFEVNASRRGSPLDSSLAILDAAGRELARNEDALGLDSLLAFTVPADGEYHLTLRDFRFRGGGDYRYRLTAGPVPYVDYIFPFGAQRGTTASVAVVGRNLVGTTQLNLAIGNDSPRSQELRIKTPAGDANLVSFEASDLPEMLETEPNALPTKAQAIPVPVVVNARAGEPGDVDHYRFQSQKDQKLIIEIAAGRFGSPLDALLVVTDTNGTVVAQNDDAAGADARVEVDAKKGTEYLVAVRDLTDRGGDRFAYRLSVRPPGGRGGAEPSFSARYLPDVVRVHRDGTARVRCEVTRAGGFEGPVRFSCEGLPSGVHVEPVVIPNAPHSGILVLAAGPGAPLGSFPLRVVASGTIAGRAVTVPAEAINGDRGVRQGYLTILDTIPFAIDALTLGLDLEQNKAGQIDVAVERRNGFTGEIKLALEGYSAGREAASRSFSGGEGVVKANESMGRIPLTPRLDSEVGIRTVIVRADATVEGREVRTWSRPIPVQVAQYPLLLSSTLPRLSLALLPPGSTSAAGEAETKIRVERRGGFAGDVELSLEGLPEGVRSEVPRVPAGVGEVAVRLFATDKARLGTNYAVTVVGSAVFQDRNYKTRTAPIGLTISLPEPVEVASTNGPATAAKPTAGATAP